MSSVQFGTFWRQNTDDQSDNRWPFDGDRMHPPLYILLYLKVRVCMVQNVYVVDSELGENVT